MSPASTSAEKQHRKRMLMEDRVLLSPYPMSDRNQREAKRVKYKEYKQEQVEPVPAFKRENLPPVTLITTGLEMALRNYYKTIEAIANDKAKLREMKAKKESLNKEIAMDEAKLKEKKGTEKALSKEKKGTEKALSKEITRNEARLRETKRKRENLSDKVDMLRQESKLAALEDASLEIDDREVEHLATFHFRDAVLKLRSAQWVKTGKLPPPTVVYKIKSALFDGLMEIDNTQLKILLGRMKKYWK